MVALGILARLIGLPETAVIAAVVESIGRKKPDALATSEKAVLLGAEAAPDAAIPGLALPDAPPQGRWSITGNEATGFGEPAPSN